MIVRVWIGTSSGRRGIDDEAIIPDVGSILVVDAVGGAAVSGGSCLVVRDGNGAADSDNVCISEEIAPSPRPVGLWD